MARLFLSHGSFADIPRLEIPMDFIQVRCTAQLMVLESVVGMKKTILMKKKRFKLSVKKEFQSLVVNSSKKVMISGNSWMIYVNTTK